MSLHVLASLKLVKLGLELRACFGVPAGGSPFVQSLCLEPLFGGGRLIEQQC